MVIDEKAVKALKAEALLNDELLQAVVSIRNTSEKKRIIALCAARAKEFGILKEFRATLNEYQKKSGLYFLIEDSKGIERIDTPYLTLYIQDTKILINIFGELREYQGGYYKPFDAEAYAYSLMPEGLKSYKHAETVKKNLLLEPSIRRTETDIADKKYICFKNCVYNVETGETTKHTSDMVFVSQIPHNFDEQAERCELTETFLQNITNGDNELRQLLLQIIGAVISGYRDFKAWFYFYGAKDTGKSTFLRIIQRLLTSDNGTQNYTSIPLERLQNSHDFGLYTLFTVNANIVTETNPAPIRNDTILKALTGGGSETMTVQRKYSEDITGTPKTMLLFAGNGEPPETWTNNSDKMSFLSRMFPIEFANVVPKEKQIIGIEDKINYSYLINLALAELREFIKNGQQFIETTAVLEKRKQLYEDADLVAKFAEEEIVICINSYLPVNEVYQRFKQWLVDGGQIDNIDKCSIPIKTFGKRLREVLHLESPTLKKYRGKPLRAYKDIDYKRDNPFIE